MSDIARVPEALADRLAVANRILVYHGIVDAFGHVSIRDPETPDRFYMARRVPPQLVTDDDIRAFDLDGEPVPQTGEPMFVERFIHSSVYHARPDVGGIVHSHSHHAIALSVTSRPLQSICHTCGFIGPGAPVFEMRDCSEPSHDLLIRSPALGDALAGTLGSESLVLMRGHGSTTVGATLEQAVYRAVHAELNARLQATASGLGPIIFLDEREVAASRAAEEICIERCWDLWRVQFA